MTSLATLDSKFAQLAAPFKAVEVMPSLFEPKEFEFAALTGDARYEIRPKGDDVILERAGTDGSWFSHSFREFACQASNPLGKPLLLA